MVLFFLFSSSCAILLLSAWVCARVWRPLATVHILIKCIIIGCGAHTQRTHQIAIDLIGNLFSQRTNWPLSPCHSVMYALPVARCRVCAHASSCVCVCTCVRLYRFDRVGQAKIKMFNYQQFQRSVQFECSSRIDWNESKTSHPFTPLCVIFCAFRFDFWLQALVFGHIQNS